MKNFILLISILLISCNSNRELNFKIDEKIYSVTLPYNWKKDTDTVLDEESMPPLLSIINTQKEGKDNGLGRVDIYLINADTKTLWEKSYINQQNTFDKEEGDIETPDFQKDQVLIGSKLLDRWKNKKEMIYQQIFLNLDDKRYLVFTLTSNGSAAEKKIEKDFHAIIESFQSLENSKPN